jgi:hypothetical protein
MAEHPPKCPDLWIPSALDYFAPAQDRTFTPHGPWKHSYYVLNIDESDFSSKIPSPQGVLHISRGKTAWGKFALDIEMLTSKHQWKAFHQTRIEARCRADTLAAPLSWQTESVILDSSINPFEETRVRQSGSLSGANVTIRDANSRKIAVPSRVCTSYGLFDVVQRLDYDNFSPLGFCMLEDMDLVKSGQTLYKLDPLTVQAPCGPMTLHGFLQIGSGILPWHYWLDETGRLILASGGLRAFVFNPGAALQNCDTRWVSHEVKAK